MKFILRGLMFEITVKLAYYQIISRVSNIESQFTLKPIQLTCGYSCASRYNYLVCSFILNLLCY